MHHIVKIHSRHLGHLIDGPAHASATYTTVWLLGTVTVSGGSVVSSVTRESGRCVRMASCGTRSLVRCCRVKCATFIAPTAIVVLPKVINLQGGSPI